MKEALSDCQSLSRRRLSGRDGDGTGGSPTGWTEKDSKLCYYSLMVVSSSSHLIPVPGGRGYKNGRNKEEGKNS